MVAPEAELKLTALAPCGMAGIVERAGETSTLPSPQTAAQLISRHKVSISVSFELITVLDQFADWLIVQPKHPTLMYSLGGFFLECDSF